MHAPSQGPDSDRELGPNPAQRWSRLGLFLGGSIRAQNPVTWELKAERSTLSASCPWDSGFLANWPARE
eukprot:3938381-Rhodomonas_salina.1